MWMAGQSRAGDAAMATSGAMNNFSGAVSSLDKPTISEQIQAALGSSTARGAMAGTGVAGLGALLTGLLRAPSTDEIAENTGRGGMVARDFARYALPGAIGGGVIGSLQG